MHGLEQLFGLELRLGLVARGQRVCDAVSDVVVEDPEREALERRVDGHVNHCVAGALASGDPAEAETKGKELLEAVHRFARVR